MFIFLEFALTNYNLYGYYKYNLYNFLLNFCFYYIVYSQLKIKKIGDRNNTSIENFILFFIFSLSTKLVLGIYKLKSARKNFIFNANKKMRFLRIAPGFNKIVQKVIFIVQCHKMRILNWFSVFYMITCVLVYCPRKISF